MIAVGLVTAILLGTTIGHTKEKQMDKNNEINKYDYVKKKIKDDEGFRMLPYTLKYNKQHINKETKVPDFVIAVKENFQTGGYGHKILEGEKEPKAKDLKAIDLRYEGQSTYITPVDRKMNFFNSALGFGKSYYDYKAKKNANDVNDEKLTYYDY